jgi:hypothetical protein
MAAKDKLKHVNITKKIARVQVRKALENSLNDLQTALGKKKFDRRIKEATRILLRGLPKSTKDKSEKSKKPFPVANEKNGAAQNGFGNNIKADNFVKER